MQQKEGKVAFSACIFDLDGTLLDTLFDLANSMNAALESLGFEPHSVDEYRYIIGDGMPTAAQRMLPQSAHDKKTIAACVKAIKQAYSEKWAENTKPYSGIAELLRELTKRRMPIAILSNKPDDFTQLIVKTLLADFKFDTVQGVSETVAKKPDPAGALAIAKRLNVKPTKILYVGDTNTDMQTAKAAGMYAVGALWGFRDAEELLASGADILINKPADLLKLIG
ncbi:MAG: HAD family hydrolase [Phycisphaerae bacterium]|nr:HAD family hydrolase [Phycisphaerae bacterium]